MVGTETCLLLLLFARGGASRLGTWRRRLSYLSDNDDEFTAREQVSEVESKEKATRREDKGRRGKSLN